VIALRSGPRVSRHRDRLHPLPVTKDAGAHLLGTLGGPGVPGRRRAGASGSRRPTTHAAGTAGETRIEVGQRRPAVRTLAGRLPVPGATCASRSDLDAQAARTGPGRGDGRGPGGPAPVVVGWPPRRAVVALDVQTGAGPRPGVGANLDPAARPADPDGVWAALHDPPPTPATNRAIQGLYAPGSTFSR